MNWDELEESVSYIIGKDEEIIQLRKDVEDLKERLDKLEKKLV